jgi:hypothetical protein
LNKPAVLKAALGKVTAALEALEAREESMRAAAVFPNVC